MGLKLIALLCLVALTIQMSSIDCQVEGCALCSTPNICQECQENFKLQALENGSWKCLKTDCSENCDTCSLNGNCYSCSKGFELTQSGDCSLKQQSEIKIIRNLQIGNQTLPPPPPPGNYSGNYTSNQTYPVYPSGNNTNQTGNFTNCTLAGCLVCGPPKTCLVCRDGFQLTASGTCISCKVPNCRQCSAPDVCSICIQDANMLRPTPNGGACISCDLSRTSMIGCVSCNGTNSCGLCQNGLQLVNVQNVRICIKCPILNCDLCGIDAVNMTAPICAKCSNGYSISPSRNACTQCVFPCSTCLPLPGPKNCATCLPPQFFPQANPNGTCIKNNIPGCIAPNLANNSLCGQCAQGFFLSNDSSKCSWNCPLNCQQCSSNITCTVCVKGFYLNSSNLCVPCQTKGCGECTSDGLTCNVCIRGFYLISSECKACPGFCQDCSSNTTCNALTESNNQVLLVVNNQTVLAVCQSICTTCSDTNPSVCLQCEDGFYLSNGKCLKCGGNCKTCDSANKQTCLSCYPNTFLSSANKCVRCDQKCMTCLNADNPANCTSCWDGFYLDGSTCTKGCPKNCFLCSNPTTCTQCLSGYTTFKRENSTVCAPCMTSCRTCAEGKPSSCLSCGSGLYLTNGTCKPCSPNCAECTEASCLTCTSGFFMTTEQTCAVNCILPCATCSATNPTKCESCIAGYTFDNVNKVCVEVTTCAEGCVVCPMGYSIKDGLCSACQKEHCQSCDPDVLTTCYSCKPGFYLDDNGSCMACSTSCTTCFSSTGCSTCAAGFTIKENAVASPEGYECVKCNSPCATCMNTPDYCTSCADGFEFSGWKCAQTFRFTVGVTLTVSLSEFEANYMTLIESLAGAMGLNDSNSITVTGIKEGSVVADLTAAPSGAPGSLEATQQLNSLTNLLKSGSVAGMSVGQMSITVDGTAQPMAQLPSEGNKLNVLAIVLGICIPVVVIVAIGVVIYMVCKRRRAAEVVASNDVEFEEKRENVVIVMNHSNQQIY